MASTVGSTMDSYHVGILALAMPDGRNFPWKPEAGQLLVIDVLKIFKYWQPTQIIECTLGDKQHPPPHPYAPPPSGFSCCRFVLSVGGRRAHARE